jgi:hypothetical protein
MTTMKTRLDMKRIARGLRAERRGNVNPAGGSFGAAQPAADVQARRRSLVDSDRSSVSGVRGPSADGDV